MGAINMFNDFVKLIESESLPVEAVAIADGDAIIAERHFVPDQDRNIYSHTKSYVSTAIGIAIEDGLLSLDSGCRLMRGHIVRMVRTVRLLRFCRSRVWLLRFNARNLVISTISFVLLCMSICCFRLLPERTTFAHTVV